MTLIFSAKRAHTARLRVPLGQREAARKLGIARQTLVNLEAGDSNPGAETLGIMAALYGVDVGFFFIESERSDTGGTAPESVPTGLAPPQ